MKSIANDTIQTVKKTVKKKPKADTIIKGIRTLVKRRPVTIDGKISLEIRKFRFLRGIVRRKVK